MTQTGYVLSVDEDGTASVEVTRESACSSCHNRENCGAGVIVSCARREKVVVRAENHCGATLGDRVEISSSSAQTLGIAFCVFVVPLLIGFFSYVLASRFIPSDIMPYVFALLLFALSFFVLFFGINARLAKKVTLRVTRVLPKDMSDSSSGDRTK